MARGKVTTADADEKRFSFDIGKFMMVFALIAIWLIFTILSNGIYIMARNMSNLFRQSVFTGLLALGMVNVIILGQIDLSVGSLAALCAGVMAIFNVWHHFPPAVSIMIAITLGLLLGLWNGWWVAYRNVPSFIVTMAGLLVFRGILVGLTDGITIGPLDSFFNVIGKEFISNTVGIIIGCLAIILYTLAVLLDWRRKKKHLLPADNPVIKIVIFTVVVTGFVLLMNAYSGIPNPVIILAVLFIIFNYISNRTVLGRRIYAIGGNKMASRLSGINIKTITLTVFAINGVMAAIAGIFLASRLNSAAVTAATSSELDAIAACVIGGTSLMGGTGTVFGVIVGAVVMASLDNGMSLMNAPSFYQTIVKGLVLLLAVWFDMSRKRVGRE